ncbi:acylphosphatase [bacterium]|nr:acylphosphatase [bacterium]
MEGSSKKRLSLVVHGRVQGVGFRYYVYKKAISLEVKGFVKNLPDGCVAIVAEGDEGHLILFLNAVRKGPAFSHVSKVDIQWGEYQGTFGVFDVTF